SPPPHGSHWQHDMESKVRLWQEGLLARKSSTMADLPDKLSAIKTAICYRGTDLIFGIHLLAHGPGGAVGITGTFEVSSSGTTRAPKAPVSTFYSNWTD